MGAIVKLKKSDGQTMTCNVEYNLLEPMLIAAGHKDGDVAGGDGTYVCVYDFDLN
eukprot:m.182979 g.182979  ORF g.182979 m.182979 type:complete len:55 (-) comp15538_c0_seq3:1975-2139(-)